MPSSQWDMMRIDKADELAFQLKACGLIGFHREYPFHPIRKWRIDIAYLEPKLLAIEVEGGGFVGGRHGTGVGIEKDCEKHSALAIMGWRLIRCTPTQVKNGTAIKWIEEALRVP